MRYLCFVTLLFFTILSCNRKSEIDNNPIQFVNEDPIIYKIIYDDMKDGDSLTQYIIIDSTVSVKAAVDTNLIAGIKYFQLKTKVQLDSSLIVDFMGNSEKQSKISLSNDSGLIYISFNKLHSIGDWASFWKNYYKTYGNTKGYAEFSNIGYNVKKNEAFIYSSVSCGEKCGEGYYYFLKKINGKWEICNKRRLWIS